MIWGLMVPPLSQIEVKVCLKRFSFLIFEPVLRAGLFDQILALSSKKSTFVLVSSFSDCCIFTILFKYYSKGCFLTK